MLVVAAQMSVACSTLDDLGEGFAFEFVEMFQWLSGWGMSVGNGEISHIVGGQAGIPFSLSLFTELAFVCTAGESS